MVKSGAHFVHSLEYDPVLEMIAIVTARKPLFAMTELLCDETQAKIIVVLCIYYCESIGCTSGFCLNSWH